MEKRNTVLNYRKAIKWISTVLVIAVATAFIIKAGKWYKKGQEIAQAFIIQKIKEQEKKLGLRTEWEKLSVSFIPIKVSVEKAKIQFLRSSVFYKPIEVEKLSISPAYWTLFQKRHLSAKITLTKPNIKIQMITEEIKNKQWNIKQYFSPNFLKKVPIIYLQLKNASLSLKKQEILLSTPSLNTSVHINPLRMKLNIEASDLKISQRPHFSFFLSLTVKRKSIHLNKFKIKNKTSWLDSYGALQIIFEKGKIRFAKFSTKASFHSKDLNAIVQLIDSQFQSPYSGRLKFQTDLQYSPSSFLTGNFDLSTEQLRIKDIFLSRIETKGFIKNKNIHLNKARIHSGKKWTARLEQSKWSLEKPYAFQTQVSIKDSQLNDLFKDFDLADVPVFSKINAVATCKGQWLDSFSFDCEGITKFNNARVQEDPETIILKLPYLEAKNQFRLSNGVFTTNLTASLSPDSSFQFESKLNEKEEFTANYDGKIKFSDIDDLLDLSPKGTLYVTDGRIQAHEDKLRIHSQLKVDDLVLDQFRLGKVETKLVYTENGLLKFNNIKGSFKKSQYRGSIGIDLFKEQLKAFVRSRFLRLDDVKTSLANRIHLPFSIRGEGSLTAKVSGPLSPRDMDYTIQSQFSKVRWAGEFFDNAVIQIEAKKGHIKTNQVEFIKNAGKIVVEGQVSPRGKLNAQIIGSNVQLQEIDNITEQMELDIAGTANFEINLTGDFFNPLSVAHIRLTNTSLRGHSIKNSDFSVRLKQTQLEATGSIAKKVNLQKFIFPYEKDKFVTVQATTNDLDLREIFFHKDDANNLYNQFRSNIHGELKLSYKKDHFKQTVTGDLKIDQMTIQTYSHQLKNQLPISIQFKNGNIKMDPISLESAQQNIHLSQNWDGKITVSGKTQLEFFIFLFPFMRIFEGNLEAKLNLSPKLFDLQPKGWIRLRKGAIQFDTDIDPFEETSAVVRLKKDHLVIESLYTKMGEGDLEIKGSVAFKDPSFTPVNLVGSFNQIHFHSIKEMYVKGSGTITLKGRSFPYVLGMSANIENALIEKEFITTDDIRTIKASSFLPQKSEEIFEPIKLDLNLNFKNSVRIENSMMQARMNGKIRITNYPSTPFLYGDLTAKPGGKIIFREHDFKILSSKITYSNTDPSNPLIDLRAQTDIQEQNTGNGDFVNEYQVLLRVKGRGKAPVFILTSTPSLSENEIVSLLTFGTKSIAPEPSTTITNIAKYSYYQIGSALFQKAIGKELTQLGVDQFLIVPYMDTKKHSTSTKVILRKKILDRLNVSASRTLLDSNPETNVKAEFKVSNHISVVGSWKNEELTGVKETPDGDISTLNNQASALKTALGFDNIIGIDLEYQIDF